MAAAVEGLVGIVPMVEMAETQAADQLAPTAHRQLAVAVEVVVVGHTKQTSTVPALGSIMAVAVVAELDCLALAVTAQVAAEEYRAVAEAELEALVGQAEAPPLEMLAPVAHTAVALAGMDTTKTLAPMVQVVAAASALSASSGALVAPIRRTPQTSN